MRLSMLTSADLGLGWFLIGQQLFLLLYNGVMKRDEINIILKICVLKLKICLSDLKIYQTACSV